MKHEREVLTAQFSPDGQRVVTASADSTARVWDAASGIAIGEPMVHEDWVRARGEAEFLRSVRKSLLPITTKLSGYVTKW
jgi:WD40 repeat protein